MCDYTIITSEKGKIGCKMNLFLLLKNMKRFLFLVLQTLKLLLIIESLESQTKELTERSILLEFCLNQSNHSSSKLHSNDYSVKKSHIPKVDTKKMIRELAIQKVIEERLLIWLMIMIGQYDIF